MKQVSRRRFIKNAGGASIALWLGISFRGNAGKTVNIAEAKNFTPYIIVDSNGSITIFTSGGTPNYSYAWLPNVSIRRLGFLVRSSRRLHMV